ncbi:MAG: hypothetical protein ACRD4P_01760 [Bryobacteraceae bacterium]
MKYCYNCNRITPGEPLFCSSCGRSYNVKLCPRLHPNPRTAEVCSRCGSRDLSTPQPRVPWWAPVLEFVLTLIPGVFLTVASVVIGLLVIVTLAQRPEMLLSAFFLFIAIGILWAMWAELPAWLRTFSYKLLRRRRQRDEGGRSHG